MEEEHSPIRFNMETSVFKSPQTKLANPRAEDEVPVTSISELDLPSDDEICDRLNNSKKRKNIISDSEDDDSDDSIPKSISQALSNKLLSSEKDDLNIFQSNASKSRIKSMSSSEDEGGEPTTNFNSDSEPSNKMTLNLLPHISQNKYANSDIKSATDGSSRKEESTKDLGSPDSNSNSASNDTEQIIIKKKRNILSQKFQNLISSRNKFEKKDKRTEKSMTSSSDSADSDDEISSIEKIKQKIKERSNHLKSTIYDPDTSDDERAHKDELVKKKIKTKSSIADSGKPLRMSAKQAMENMQKIKSESNRMLREKEVSLPYHRPKALNLKDIMNRRKPAIAADGKALPLKMNEDQLRQYARLLEERQKEMIELCKSESEGEAEEELETTITDNKEDTFNTEQQITEINNDQAILKNPSEDIKDISVTNDEHFDSKISKANETSVYATANEDTSIVNEEPELFKSNIESTDADNPCTEPSQFISLQYDSEKIDTDTPKDQTVVDKEFENNENVEDDTQHNNSIEEHSSSYNISSSEHTITKVDQKCASVETVQESLTEESKATQPSISEESAMDVSEEQIDAVAKTNKTSITEDFVGDGFSDDNMEMADIDKMIEDADIIIENSMLNGAMDSPMLVRDFKPTISKPKLTGGPGMVIDLDGADATGPKKLSGIDLLKERFSYFTKLKTPDEIERQTKNRIKPGTQHLILKQQLENEIAEQRSLEWHKRLEDEKIQQAEMDVIRGEGSDEDDIEKIEAKLQAIDEKDDDSSSESEPEEDDVILDDKPSNKNPLVDDEAEESDPEDDGGNDADDEERGNNYAENEKSDDESSDDSSDDDIDSAKPKKGRILKAFEDSDDEENRSTEVADNAARQDVTLGYNCKDNPENSQYNLNEKVEKESEKLDELYSQDDELNSAQLQKSISEDMFSSQDSAVKLKPTEDLSENAIFNGLDDANKLPIICETQQFNEVKFDDIVGMCSGSFSQNADTLIVEPTQKKSLEIGDNILDLCTGNFYDNQFVSQNESTDVTQNEKTPIKEMTKDKAEDGNLLHSILSELNDPEFDNPKPNKFFTGGDSTVIETKKRFVIDSDDEEENKPEVKKKKRRKKLEDRALQISDDEDEDELGEEEEELVSEDEFEDNGDDAERLVEYDSEENEVELQPNQEQKKKKRNTTDFFEQEAELTSEDEYVGSGDEDEGGLDRMEREEGDQDHFHQGRLRRELGQIHMREVMDQDKREVRLLQELLLEDGDLGGGSRQRKFRWKNAEGDEATGTNADELGDTQEEEFESEEQWRKQRHERDVFLRQMQQKEGDQEESINVSLNRSAIIKASLKSADASVHTDVTANENKPVQENKAFKAVPSPVKKPFGLMQQKFVGSFLARGSGALARLGALAAPLAAGGERGGARGAPGKGSFVFAAKEPEPDTPKVSKRKADSVLGTPNLMKKLKTEEKRKLPSKSSLLDHFKM